MWMENTEKSFKMNLLDKSPFLDVAVILCSVYSHMTPWWHHSSEQWRCTQIINDEKLQIKIRKTVPSSVLCAVNKNIKWMIFLI